MPTNKSIKKALILGSGALKIGEAGEFDYSGSQAIKALKEEKIKVILVNPNIATIQTSDYLADEVYFLPVDPYFVEQVIAKEKPDGLILSFGGQTALNCGMALAQKGVLAKYQVRVLGTPVKMIEETEDRWLFVKKLNQINILTPKSRAVKTVAGALKAAEEIGFPVMLRNGFSLGGKNSGVAHNKKELTAMAKRGLLVARQVLIEEYLGGWKEIEYEVVRDENDNCLTVCNMENFDPMGIHTGESIVVAPSQTLNNEQYHLLREVAIKTIRHLGIVGECNIQYGLDPHSNDYRIIEVNARLSRSSALASKATGYPLAFVAAKLALGHTLAELPNSITKITKAFFEPALDYLVVKIPRWDLKKFRKVSPIIGSEMKSVGEVMAIGRCFEEALQKALRMLNIGVDGLLANSSGDNHNSLEQDIKQPTPERVFTIARALEQGVKIETLRQWSKIDPWFLHKIKNIVETSQEIKKAKRPKYDLVLKAKQQGFSDKQVGNLLGCSALKIKELRKKQNILPFIKQIDTLAAEYPAKTNYLYLTYNGQENDIKFKAATDRNKIIVLGSGPYCIGSSVEFDWCCVNTVRALRKMGFKTIVINCNPETVSTDYDECDKLYFEELTVERVIDIYEREKPLGVIVSMGGQIPNNLSLKLAKAGVKILGTKAKDIDRAEDRHKFSQLLDELNIEQPLWQECSAIEKARNFANKVGYPVLVRPSYVLSGAAMSVVFQEKNLESYLKKAAQINTEHPVVVTKFISGAKEIEIDAVAQKGVLLNYVITEHVENAGVHSGDATIVMPAHKLYVATLRQIKNIARQLVTKLNITGPFNIQFLAKNSKIKVIECNLRAARTMPFISKVSKVNLIELAAKAISGKKVEPVNFNFVLDYVAVKAPQFSFARLAGADPILNVEMASTGEVACFGDTLEEAYLKSLLATGFKMPKKNILLSLGGIKNQSKFLDPTKKLRQMGYQLYATPGTSKFLSENSCPNKTLQKISTRLSPNIRKYIEQGKIDLVINIADDEFTEKIPDDYFLRRKAVDFEVPLLTNLQAAELFVNAISTYKLSDLQIKSWGEYK